MMAGIEATFEVFVMAPAAATFGVSIRSTSEPVDLAGSRTIFEAYVLVHAWADVEETVADAILTALAAKKAHAALVAATGPGRLGMEATIDDQLFFLVLVSGAPGNRGNPWNPTKWDRGGQPQTYVAGFRVTAPDGLNAGGPRPFTDGKTEGATALGGAGAGMGATMVKGRDYEFKWSIQSRTSAAAA